MSENAKETVFLTSEVEAKAGVVNCCDTAKWYGKVSTTLFYIAIGLIVVMDGFMKVSESTFNIASTTALVITAGFMVYTFIRYFGVFREILRSTDGKYDLNLPEEMRAKKERTPKN